MKRFFYGSNLDEAQMRRRCPGAALRDYKLTFGGVSVGWGGAVASVVPKPGSSVPGLLYAIGPDDLAALDDYEGHPLVYERVQRLVVDEHGRRRRVHL